MGLVINEHLGRLCGWTELIRRNRVDVDPDDYDSMRRNDQSHLHPGGVPAGVQPTDEDGNGSMGSETLGLDRPGEEIVSVATRNVPCQGATPPQANNNRINGLETRRITCRAELSEKRSIEISRADIFGQTLDHYDNTQNYCLSTHKLHIKFTEEKGADFEGLSREFFTAFWDPCFLKLFKGKKMFHPRVGSYPSSPSAETWQKLGVILSHGFVLVDYLPPSFSKACIYFLLSGREPSPRIIIESFFSTLSENDVSSLTMAMNTNPSQDKFPESLMTQLTIILSHFHSSYNLTPSNIKIAVESIARNWLIESPYYALCNMRKGMISAHPSLWSHPPSDNDIFSLLNSYTLTAENVISRLQVENREDSTQAALEAQVFDWFKQIIWTLTSDQLKTLLRFITSSNILNGNIDVSFDGSQNEMGMVHVSTCGRQIIFSRYFLSSEALETYLLNIINNPDLWNTFDTV